jgi:hypothetical protein
MRLGLPGEGFLKPFLQGRREFFIENKLPLIGPACRTGVGRTLSFVNIPAQGAFPFFIHGSFLNENFEMRPVLSFGLYLRRALCA